MSGVAFLGLDDRVEHEQRELLIRFNVPFRVVAADSEKGRRLLAPGLAAAVYAASEGLRTVVLEEAVSGRAGAGGRHVIRCCTSLGEQVALPRDELFDGFRGPAGDFLDGGGHAVIPILAM